MATLAHLTFLHVYISFVALMVSVWIWQLWVKPPSSQNEETRTSLFQSDLQKKYIPLENGSFRTLKPYCWSVLGGLLPSAVMLALIYVGPIQKILKLKELFFGGKGFWSSTVTSLIESSLYYHPLNHTLLLLLLKIGVFFMLMFAAGALFKPWIHKRSWRLSEKWLGGILLWLVICASAITSQWHLFHTKFVIGRAACFFILLFMMMIIAFCYSQDMCWANRKISKNRR